MKWFNIDQIGRVQLELTNYCNAACPQCDRYEQIIEWKDPDLNNSHITLENIKDMFGNYNWTGLEKIHFCGNVDEPTINPEMLEITKYLLRYTKRIDIASNGGTRNVEFWKELGKLSKESNVSVIFGLDGLEDTNHIYRRNVKWEIVKRNWQAYINAGGEAYWQFIVFNHNKHQLKKAKKISQQEGFVKFHIIQSDRADVLEATEETDVKIEEDVEVPKWYEPDPITIDGKDIKDTELECVRCPAKLNSNISGFHKTKGSIYVSAKGYVTPCCWMGNPRELIKLWKSSDISPKEHNIHFNNLQDIIKGKWFSKIDSQMQEFELCVKKCKNLSSALHL
tara:strand:+ start:24573 stop:25583 length:1011 start_codon:yes stop_codon:yes gene_type:complete